MLRRFCFAPSLALAFACGSPAEPAPRAPCYTIQGDPELRAKDASKVVEAIASRIQLAPEDEALRHPKSLDDVKTILKRDTVYLFADAAAYARSLNTTEGRFAEASMELLRGESELVASQVLTVQAAWVSADLRVARASLASGPPSTDRARMLAQLIRAVEEGNKIADALGVDAPAHLAHGAEVIRALRVEAPNDMQTSVLVAEYHRLRGEWTEFDAAMTSAEASQKDTPALAYLRAMEQLERYRKPDAGADILHRTLVAHPHFVRAQAALVLMATRPRDALAELAKLEAMNQDHWLVMLLKPTLAADQELGRMQDGRDAPH